MTVSTWNGRQTSKTVITTLYSIASLNLHNLANWEAVVGINQLETNSHMCWNAREFRQFIGVGRSNKINK